MPNVNEGVLDGARRIASRVRDLIVDGGVPGAPLGFRLRGATASGAPTTGTWRTGDIVPDRTPQLWLCTAGGTPGTWIRVQDQPWQFRPETYGAAGDMQIAHDFAITSGAAVLTTVGVATPSAPSVSNSASGGTILAGTYQVKITFSTATGETLPSSASSTTTSGSTSTITVTAPAIVPGGATGWTAYITAAGGSTFFKQMTVTAPWPFQNNFTLTAPPNTSTAQPPAANTTVSSPWALMKTGQAIRVIGAGAAGADLRTTISSVTGASATLAANASTTISNGTGAVWGTDDTAAVQAAINAASAYTAANNRTGEVLFTRLYLSNTAPVVGGNYGGNCVIQLPSIPNGQAKQRVSLIGASRDVSTLPTYQQMVPEMSGTGIIYIGPVGTNDATYGAAHVFGTPTNPNIFLTESGNIPGTTNIKTMMDSLRIIVPFKGGIGGIDLISAAESANYNCSTQALGIIPSGGSWTTIPANGPSANQFGWGLREPGAGNNAQSYTEQFTCEGTCYGYGPSEHLVAVDIFVAYNVTGLEGAAGNSISMVHNGHILSAGAEFCTNAVGAIDGLVRLDIDNLRTESTSKVIFDPSNRLQGRFGVRDQGAAGVYKTLGTWVANGAGTGVTLYNLMTTPGPLSSPQAPPASGAAWFNGYFLNAWITLSATTITALSVSNPAGTSVAQNGLAGSPATYSFFLGAGHSYTPTYTGTLTHTVYLLPTY